MFDKYRIAVFLTDGVDDADQPNVPGRSWDDGPLGAPAAGVGRSHTSGRHRARLSRGFCSPGASI